MKFYSEVFEFVYLFIYLYFLGFMVFLESDWYPYQSEAVPNYFLFK